MSYETVSATSTRKSTIAVGFASFVGMLAAVPLSFALATSVGTANAAPSQQSAHSAVSGPRYDYDDFMHGYQQGFTARTASSTQNQTLSSDDPFCVTVGDTMNENWVMNEAPDVHVNGASWGGGRGAGMPDAEQAWQQYVTNSYNSDYSQHNASYVNSNNTVGSHNTTSSTSSTNVDVKDSHGVVVAANSESNATNETYYEGNSEIKDSYNTDNSSTTETKVEDSFNTETEVKTENDTTINNTTNTTTTTTNDETNNQNQDSSNQDAVLPLAV